EIYNGTGNVVDLSGYSIRRYGDATDFDNGYYTVYTFPSTLPTINNGQVLYGQVYSNILDANDNGGGAFTYDIDCDLTGGNWNCGGFNAGDIFHLYNGTTLIDVYYNIYPSTTANAGYSALRNINTGGPNTINTPSD